MKNTQRADRGSLERMVRPRAASPWHEEMARLLLALEAELPPKYRNDPRRIEAFRKGGRLCL